MLLTFFDPQEEPYGVFSNIARIPVQVGGEVFPTVQHAIYMKALGSLRDPLKSVYGAYDLRMNFESLKERKYLADIAHAVRVAYSARLSQQPIPIESHKRYIFYPTQSTLSERRSKYVLGVDNYRYGYNIVGKTLQDLYHGITGEEKDPSFHSAVYLAYLASRELMEKIHNGDNLSAFGGLLPSEILHKMGFSVEHLLEKQSDIDFAFQQYQDKTLQHYPFVRMEMDYPRSIAFFIRKKEAPFINYYIHNCIRSRLLHSTLTQFVSAEYDIPPSLAPETIRLQMNKLNEQQLEGYKDRLLAMYSEHKVPTDKEVQYWVSQRLTDEQVRQSLDFIPMNIIPEFGTTGHVLDLSNGHELDPVYPTEFQLDGFVFYSVLHAIYYGLFVSVIDKSEAYRLLLVENVKKPTGLSDFLPASTTDFDQIYDRISKNAMVETARIAMKDKFTKEPLMRLLWRTEKEGITGFQYNDPHDALFGYIPQLAPTEGNFMNQAGKLLLQIRNDIQPVIKEEYSFFSSFVGENEFLQSWLKTRLTDWQQSLMWFKKLMGNKLDPKDLRLFFSKFYTPIHTIYRFEDLPSTPPNAFFTKYFHELGMSKECLSYVYDHFVSMYSSLLKNSDGSTEILQQNIQKASFTVSPDIATILRKCMALLQYVPHRYQKKVLGYFTSLLMGKQVTIPDKTFFSAPTIVYTYSAPGLSTLLADMTMPTSSKGDISFVVSHIFDHISPERYHFFFA